MCKKIEKDTGNGQTRGVAVLVRVGWGKSTLGRRVMQETSNARGAEREGKMEKKGNSKESLR